MSVKLVPLESITVPEDRQRKSFPEQEMQELADSIQAPHGLFTPLFVRPSKEKGKYILVAGERRLRALSSIEKPYTFGEETVSPGYAPVVVKNLPDDITAYEAELHENLIRLNLSWQEQAEAVAKLHRLKKEQDPRHTAGMTAMLLEDSSYEGDYASSTKYRQVNASLLVADHLNDPDVRAAKSLSAANKVISKKLEEDYLALLRKKKAETPKVDPQPKEDTSVLDDLFPSDSTPVSPVKKKPTTTKIGTFYHGDMREEIKKIEDGSIQVVLTDPPYGMGVDKFNDGGSGTIGHTYSEEGFEELHEILVKELDRICTKTAHVYIFCDIDYFVTLRDMMLATEQWRVRRTPLVWDKVNGGKLSDGIPAGYRRSYELILHATRGNRPCAEVSSDVLKQVSVKGTIHGAQKPVALYKQLLKMSAVPGDKVFDAFAGSGTIFQAAKDLFLDPIGIEISDTFAGYCEMARTQDTTNYEIEF